MSLISVGALAARIGDPAIRVVDVRWYLGRQGDGRTAYEAGHVPGAIFADLDADLAAPAGPGGRHPLPDPSTFAARLGALGIGSDHEVIAYDDSGGAIAARLWWMLDDLGHRNVSLLDGGFPAWEAFGQPIETGTGPSYPPAELKLAQSWTKVLDRDALLARLGEVVLLDARAAPRYRGEVEPIDPVAGHIPTARSAPAGDNLGPDGRFLAPDPLRVRFATLGVRADDPSQVVTSCGSGVTACQNALAMRLAGLPDPILYAGSWSEWSTAGYPVAVGPEPGDLPTE
jgi:thiosulfate/3-mercaptopyruvate sulfurtransferase